MASFVGHVFAAPMPTTARHLASRQAQRVEETAEFHHQLGVAYHLRRCLDDASREYARALELDPPRDLTNDEWQLVRRFAPRVYVTPTEFFPLKDFAVVVHPTDRLIAYHFFWEDDIDFPEDNDPCDHELIWVRYSADRMSLEKVWTYFHGRLLDGGDAALSDARSNRMRPRVNVQWGKHGSMPQGWETLKIIGDRGDAESKYYPIDQPIPLKLYNEGTFRKLSVEGRRLVSHPLGRRANWPQKFAGAWEDFINFSRLIEPLDWLDKSKLAAVSRWNSATINQHFLRYNFRPKTEWPVEEAKSRVSNVTSAAPALGSLSLDDFRLPPKSAFDKTMPRYPNLWFYVEASLAPTYQASVKLVTEQLRQAMRLREYYGPFDNAEGCDFEVRLEHLQPWEVREQRALQHSHAFHMRYYYTALAGQKLERVKVNVTGGVRDFFRFAASVHYEVEHTNPNHADVETCPICGRTGDYRELKGNLVELVHDPLGLELVMTGKIRGETVRFEEWDQREVGGIAPLTATFAVRDFTFPAQAGDRNTLRIGVVVLTPKDEAGKRALK
ncbi:MAG: tetratricopeptide repeat protein [Blastocatellia bacterium]